MRPPRNLVTNGGVVRSHGAWAKTDSFVAAVVKSWQVMARALGSVPDTVIQGIFPWCFTPEMYATKPESIAGLHEDPEQFNRATLEFLIRQEL